MAATGGTDGERPRRGLGGRLAFWAGVAMMLVGVVLLGYVGWQFWGTNWVADRHQREITHALRQQWREGSGEQLSPKRVPRGQASALVRIPAFGKDYVVPTNRAAWTFVRSCRMGEESAGAVAAKVPSWEKSIPVVS